MLTRFDLYELAVQAPALQARFLHALHPAKPRILREDFCGPASIARAWLDLAPDCTSIGVDIDPEPLAHAQRKFNEDHAATPNRLRLLCSDVRECREPADVIAAFNFAACELHERNDLLAYCRSAHASLSAQGLLAFDIYGGPDAFERGASKTTIDTPIGPVRYAWQQIRADPCTGRVKNAMHFRFPDGAELRSAFRYNWRLWSIPELRDVMRDAGFTTTEVHLSYGESLDDDGAPVPRAHQGEELEDASFVAYVVARKS